jgi:hypothetical protein
VMLPESASHDKFFCQNLSFIAGNRPPAVAGDKTPPLAISL